MSDRVRTSRGNRSSREPQHQQSMTAILNDAAKYYECSEYDGIYSDKSLTKGKQLIHYKPFEMTDRIVRETSRTHKIIPDKWFK